MNMEHGLWIPTFDHKFISFSGHSIQQTLGFFRLCWFDLYLHPLWASGLFSTPLFPFGNDFTRLQRNEKSLHACSVNMTDLQSFDQMQTDT